jgi:hypothetical protein
MDLLRAVGVRDFASGRADELLVIRPDAERTTEPVCYGAMPPQVLQRPEWNGEPKAVGDMFRLHKDRSGQQLEAACRLTTQRERDASRSVVKATSRSACRGCGGSIGGRPEISPDPK